MITMTIASVELAARSEERVVELSAANAVGRRSPGWLSRLSDQQENYRDGKRN